MGSISKALSKAILLNFFSFISRLWRGLLGPRACRPSNFGVKNIVSGGCAGFTHYARVWAVVIKLCSLCTSIIDVHVMVTILISWLRLALPTQKEFCYKLPLTLLKSLRERDWGTVKSDGGGQIVVVFTIKEINYLVITFFYGLVWSLSYLYLWY